MSANLRHIFRPLLLILLLYSCSRPNEVKTIESHSATYVAIDGNDTAKLELTTKGTTFKGKCAINVAGRYTDSGEVKGLVRGDTLLGDFHYLHYGLEWKWVAFALLRKGQELHMGEGDQGEYFNIPYFKADGPRFDTVRLIFKPIATAR